MLSSFDKTKTGIELLQGAWAASCNKEAFKVNTLEQFRGWILEFKDKLIGVRNVTPTKHRLRTLDTENKLSLKTGNIENFIL